MPTCHLSRLDVRCVSDALASPACARWSAHVYQGDTGMYGVLLNADDGDGNAHILASHDACVGLCDA